MEHRMERNGVIVRAQGNSIQRRSGKMVFCTDKRKFFFAGTNKPSSIRDYVNGLENGKLVSYGPRGNIELEAETKDGFFHGKWTSFVRGLPRVERTYNLGVLEGKTLIHWMNGKFTEVRYYKNSLIIPEKTKRVSGINPRPLREDLSDDDVNNEEIYDDEEEGIYDDAEY
ncbi:hypothetical protein D1R32_gp208 [Tunisvirus fontaine2]|uniref:MORN repeat-containing protein n=1 Tax=Tunisvirus fontaine2 TaxID=1421067 RepID=V9SDW6_9VIRU|nr:hypothetical protein D1R32_gp208 [Tunisvirus fontaine2]AHC54925.1 hypothetical protein TNS_ORF207 [Tunisvirus fontaine2]